MAVYHPYPVQCNCGEPLLAPLAEGVNVKRTPEVREQIIAGTFHRVRCANCNRETTVEKEFFYTDFTRNAFIKVKPRQERHLWKQASEALDADVRRVPESLSRPKDRKLRVVFGLAELREKLIAEDADLDDRVVELLKVLLIYEHPFLVHRPRLRINLDRVTDERVEFVAAYDHSDEVFSLGFPRATADDVVGRADELREWVARSHTRSNIFEDGERWINFWRWSPQPTALDRLRTYADRLEKGEEIDTEAADFKSMLGLLPRGAHLPAWAKQDLRTVFLYARREGLARLEDALFEIRFGKPLEDDWSLNNDPDDIDTLWKLLKDLPDTNVEGNTFINEIKLDVGKDGGSYYPSTRDIYIGGNILQHRETFEDVVRHEVGHGVHELHRDRVNPWLVNRFGWRTFESTDAGIDEWVGLMGGWGTLTQTQRAQVRGYLRTALGAASSWTPGGIPNVPVGHPWWEPDFGPRLAYENTGSYWYANNARWHRFNGKAFFLNYWYKTFIAVDADALDLVGRMPSAYASMSHFEFFAELYALYYDLDDPQRKHIPEDVVEWMVANLGAPEAGSPSAPTPPKDYETIVRPGEPSE